jgi:hypothetical protein
LLDLIRVQRALGEDGREVGKCHVQAGTLGMAMVPGKPPVRRGSGGDGRTQPAA